jgi:hypothetical protein
VRDFRGPGGREESPKKRWNRKRHGSEEVVAALRQAIEAMAKDTPIAEVVRSLEVSEVILHRWRAGSGGVDRRSRPHEARSAARRRRTRTGTSWWPGCGN